MDSPGLHTPPDVVDATEDPVAQSTAQPQGPVQAIETDAAVGSQSFLQFIHYAVSHDRHCGTAAEELDDAEARQALLASPPPRSDALSSSIYAIHLPIERQRHRQRLDSSPEPGIDQGPHLDEQHAHDPRSDTDCMGSGDSDEYDEPTATATPAEGSAADTRLTTKIDLPRRARKASPFASEAERCVILSEKLKDVFGLQEREDVLAEFQAFLFRSVLLQGYLYITSGHVCFYAYLRGKEGQTIKSSTLSKKASRSRRYLKHWFVLKDDVLRWYPSASEPYFPDGDVSLHYITSVSPSRRSPLRFKVLTADRELSFSAESTAQRDDWVKTLTKAVFQCQNEGDSVKISIPLEAILSVDKTSMEFIDALSLRVYDADNAGSVDTYPFCYLSDLQDTYERIQSAVKAFQISRPDLMQRSMDRISDTTPHRGQDFSVALNDTSSKGSASAPTTSLTSLVSRFNPFAAATPETERKRRPSTDTITQVPPNFAKSSTLNEKHTYPPDTGVPSLSESPGRQVSWTMSTLVKNAPRLISSVTPSSVTVALPSLATFGLAPSKEGRKVTEKVDGPKHQSDHLAIHADDEFGDTSVISLKKEEPPSQADGLEKDKALFHSTFNLPPSEELIYKCHAHVYRGLPIYGNLFLSATMLSFKSTNLFSDTRMMLPLKDLIAAQPHRSYRFGYYGLVLVVRSHEELFFELSSQERRDMLQGLIEYHADYAKQVQAEGRTPLSRTEAQVEAEKLEFFQQGAEEAIPSPEEIAPIMFRSTSSSFVNFKPPKPLRFTCLTIGSRGDVQPYIALCQGLIREGHSCRIASHGEYRQWVESHGIAFEEVGGDPAELMRICVQHGMFTIGFMKEGLTKFRGWLDDLLQSSWIACQNSDVLIESPSAMAGIHIAEALRIPYFRAFTMPWTRTRTYAHAFATPESKLGGQYNYLSYTMFDTVFWRAIAGQVNRWRKLTLNLPSTSLDKLEQGKVPFLYNLSPSLMPPPLDWPEWVHVTGYWFLEDDSQKTGWSPPPSLTEFLSAARRTQKKLVYIGFGSIVVADPEGLTRTVHAAVESAGVAAIVSKGWSSRLSADLSHEKDKLEFELQQEREKQLLQSSDNIYTVDSIPHDWLFPQLDAVVHHGGSGTTGASLRAGVPTIIKPFFGDQFFQAERVESLGVGIALKKMTTESLSQALVLSTTDVKQKRKADLLGKEIRGQNGVSTAIEMLYRDMEYARAQIKHPAPSNSSQTRPGGRSAALTVAQSNRARSLSTTEDGASVSEESSWDQLSYTAADEVLSRSGIGSTPPRSLYGDDENPEAVDAMPRTRAFFDPGPDLVTLYPSSNHPSTNDQAQ